VQPALRVTASSVQETEAKAEYEAELRQQLSRQAAAHSDHLVSVLHAQRLKLEAEFEKQLIDAVKTEKLKMMDEINVVVNRLNAVESAVNGQLLFLSRSLSLLQCSTNPSTSSTPSLTSFILGVR